MDTNFLKTFLVVVEHGSLAEAARRLGLTPAAVAQRIKALESEIGTALLTRVGQTVRPTIAGQAILSRAQDMIRNVRDLCALATDKEVAGELRLGVITTATTSMLPDVLSRMVDRYPRLEIYVKPGTSVELYQSVLDADIDAALMVEPPMTIPKALEWQTLRHERMILIAPVAMAKRDPLDLLRNEPFIRYDRNHWGGRLADTCLQQLGIRPLERFELDSLSGITVLVSRGLGVSLIPDWAPPWPEGLSLARIDIPDSKIARHIGLLWPRSSVRVKLVQAFLEELKKTENIDGRTVKPSGKTSGGRGRRASQPESARSRTR
ncbi:LysR substrate-binding domain-containing protein [Afipia sp. Root123D2]|uniref:LysR substrate-binding domain-containing protein n=1 Tax=Afipia sp. Root123D2 TaxID=1736436 RepID=UPI0009E83BC6|nr:LysR substrate-binding domain-containing protein [Afipia sp. Root123D2]